MDAREYAFEDRLLMSAGHAESFDVQTVLLKTIPGALSVQQAATENDRIGVDWWVEMIGGRHIAIDAKVRQHDWAATHPGEDDLALETWSVVESRVVGWTRDTAKRCDYVLWLWADTGRYCLLPFPMLCRVFIDNWQHWSVEHKVRRQRTTGRGLTYHSECVFVPRRDIWAAIYSTFAGSSAVHSFASQE
jgi:hypothetical protein